MTHAVDAELGLSSQQIGEINRAGEAAMRNLQQHTPPHSVLIESALYGALSDQVGSSRHSANVEVDGRLPRAQIMGVSIAHADRSLANQTPTAAFVNQRSGTLAVAAGTGSRVGVEATVRTFERRGARERIWRASIADASSIAADAMFHTAPKVIQATQEALQANPDSTAASGLGVQIIDDTLVYSGKQPLLIFNVQTKEFIWLNDNTSPTEPGVYKLDSGRHMVLMCAGPDATSSDMGSINEAFLAGLKLKPDARHQTEEEAGQAKATQIASYVQQALSGGERDVTVVAAAVHVAGQPVSGLAPEPSVTADSVRVDEPEWHDTRSRLRRMTDLGRWGTFAFMAAAQVFDPTIRDQRRRQIYERVTQQHGVAGKVGRAALIATDVAIGTGLAYTAARLVGHDLVPHLGHEIVVAEHLLGLSDSSHTTGTHTAQADMHQVAAGTAATGNQPSTPAVHDDQTPQQLANATGTHPAAVQLPDTYTALAHDPHRGGKPSTIYDIDRYLLGEQAQAHGATAAQIAGLQHDDKILDGGVAAFIGDQSDPDNGRAAHNSQMGINANTEYSVHDLKAYNEKVIAGLVPTQPAPAPATPVPQTADVAPPATQHPVTAQAPALADSMGQTEKIAIGVAEGVGAAAAIGIGWFGLRKLTSRRRRRREAAAERLATSAPSVSAAQALASIPPEAVPMAGPGLARHRNTGSTGAYPVVDPTDPSMEAITKTFEVPEPPTPVGPFVPYRVDAAPADVTASYRAASGNGAPKKPEDDPFVRFYNGMGRIEERPVHGKGKRYRELLKSGEKFSLGTLRVTRAWVKRHPLKTDKPDLLTRLGSLFSPKRRQKAALGLDQLTALETSNETGTEAREPELAGAAA